MVLDGELRKSGLNKNNNPKEKTYPVMYLFVNKGINMSPGKMAAQTAHAACCAQRISNDQLINDWYEFGFYTKIVLEARSERHLETIKKYLEERDIKTSLIIDEGRTELNPHTMTALGVEVIDKNIKGEIFKSFKLYKPEFNITVKFN